MAYLRSGGVIVTEGGGGGSDPTFTSTLICDNTAESTGAITFTDDYENYDLLDIELYNNSYLYSTHFLTSPSVISSILSVNNRYINFNEFGINQYKCYRVSTDHLTWEHSNSRNVIIKSVHGLTCTNKTVTTTEFYKRANITPSVVSIEPVEDLADYDYIFLGICDGSWDETQPNLIPIYISKINTEIITGVWHRYNNAGMPVHITNHSISATDGYNGNANNYIQCAYGVKFT